MRINKISFSANNHCNTGFNDISPKKYIKIGSAIVGTALLATGAYYYLTKAPKKITQAINNTNIANNVSSYKKSLIESLSKRLNKIVAPEDLDCIIEKEQFLQELQKLNQQNYIASKNNINNGIFCVDLHSHSNISDGKITVSELMNQVADYSEKLYQTQGKKLLFSLTDHDSIDGVKEAFEIIATNPQKFKYMKFIAGSEVSYIHQSPVTQNPCETSEFLIYGFNPFAEKTNRFFDNIQQKRQKLIVDYIQELRNYFPDANYNIDEFKQVYLTGKSLRMNLHWKIYHYGQTKKAISELAKVKNQNPNDLYIEIMNRLGKQKYLSTLKDRKIISENVFENNFIENLNNKYRPNFDGTICTVSENKPEEIFETFSPVDTVIGFAHPYYMTERLYDVKAFAEELIKKSNGLIKLTESYHQAYNDNITKYKIHEINQIMENFGLINIGGRDNHQSKWLQI